MLVRTLQRQDSITCNQSVKARHCDRPEDEKMYFPPPSLLCFWRYGKQHLNKPTTVGLAVIIVTCFRPSSVMQVDIPALLASSSLPTEAERVYLNQLLDTSNDEISCLTTAIDKLVLQREALKSKVTSYKAILAPIRCLPEDMLREIFIHCLPTNKAAAIATTAAPLLFGLICRSWRDFALSTPALWASIQVQFSPSVDSVDVQRLCNEAKTWLARSGTCPLTIGVNHGYCTDPVAIQFVQSLTDISARWRSIEIAAPAQWLLPLASLSNTDVPKLEKFSHWEVTGPWETGGPWATGLIDQVGETIWQSLDILGAGRLQDVTLSKFALQDTAAAAISKINFGQLTRLTLNTGLTFMDAAEILRRCPNLKESHMSITRSPSADAEHNFEPITLLHLCSFTFIMVYPGQVVLEQFFSSLDLPQLTSFNHNMGGHSTVPWIHLVRTSPIENLSLSLSDLRDQSLLHYLRANTLIKRLQINYFSGIEMDCLPLLLAIDNASDVLCPFLEVLEVLESEPGGWGYEPFLDIDFVKLVRRRAALSSTDGKPHLKVVRAKFSSSVHIRVISQLDDLIASGLSLYVSYPPPFTPEGNTCYWPCKPADDWPMSW
ncbi:hypothetical protein C8J56DRAFT_479406 [Mycena floridula]|nr:hypothetical protein C8J56DRAFT_479406 [Mycena floridula]